MSATSGTGKACMVGGGVIGGGWAARFLLHGWEVSVFDPHPEAVNRICQVLANARETLPALAEVPMPAEGTLHMAESLQEAVAGADWIQESAPEELALKQKVIADIQAHAPESAILASSTSGFKPSDLREGARHPGRILVAHPFNPVYLLPLVEVVAGEGVAEGVLDRARQILTAIGMRPLIVRKEIDAHIADRLLESLWREALWLINDDVATTEEIDAAVRYGFGLRWAQMGVFETYRLAGGEEGMAHFMRQFGPALQWPWTHLSEVPELSEELVQKIARQSDAQSGGYSIQELVKIRDRNLVGLLRSLKAVNWGAGAVLNEHDRRLCRDRADSLQVPILSGQPMRMLELTVLPSWIDYNDHMTEFRYLQVFGDTTDRLLSLIGMDRDYVASGRSYYTVETHIMHRGEAKLNERLYSTTQVLHVDEKRLHVFHHLHAVADDRLVGSAEHMLLHVDSVAGKSCPADPALLGELTAIAAAHAGLPRPEGAGRAVGESK